MYDPSTQSVMDLEKDLIAFCREAAEAGKNWAEAKSTFEQLKDLKDVVFAQNFPEEGTQGEKTNAAKKSEEYRMHIEGMAVAREEMLKFYVKYESANAKFEAIRTIISNRREQMKKGIE